MTGVAVPRAEQSGSHRVVDVEVGDVRKAIAYLAGVSSLARTVGAGPRVLRDALPELRAACLALPMVVAGAVIPACDVVALSTGLGDDARRVVDALVAETRRVSAFVLATLLPTRVGLDRPPSAPLGAGARLALRSACDAGVADLGRVRTAIELLQRASTSEPIPVALDDLFRELDSDGQVGQPVELTISGATSSAVAVHPRVGTAVLLRALAQVRQRTPGAAFSAVARVAEGRVQVDIHLRARRDPLGTTLNFLLPEPASWDERILRLAAATLAAPLHVDARGVRLDLLRASA